MESIKAAADKIAALKGWRRAGAAFFAGAGAALALAPFYILPFMAVGFAVLVLLIDGAGALPRPKPVSYTHLRAHET